MRSSPWHPASLRGRLLRDTLVALLVAMAFYAVVLALLFRAGSESLVRDGLWGQAEDIERALVYESGRVRVDLHDPMRWGYDAYFQNLKYRVLDGAGRVLVTSDADGQPLTREDGRLRLARDFFQRDDGGTTLQVGTFPIQSPLGPLYVQTARSDRFFDLAGEAILPVVVETSLLVGFTSLLLFGGVVLIGLRRALLPVSQASAEARAIDSQDLSRRLSTDGVPEEIRPLIDGFNAALQRIERAFAVEQRFIANAAHELKTPLAILRAQVELHVEPRTRARLLSEIDGMTHTVTQLLSVAEAADRSTYRFAPVDLVDLAHEVSTLMATFAEQRSVALTVVVSDAVPQVRGDRMALQMALRNLVDNAIRHAPPGSRVAIEVEHSVLRVLDEGAGLDETTRGLLFERFWREDRAGQGSGLGLAIVREVVEAHGGAVTAGNRADRAGAVFEITLHGKPGPQRPMLPPA